MGRQNEEWAQISMRLMESINDVGKANLAKYIVHRKVLITLLEKSLKRRDTGMYPIEEIHKIIFPLKNTSDDITYEDHNLWIIDERLAYHNYLSSDIPLKQVKKITSKSDLRPDSLMFNTPIALVGEEAPYSSIVIFEFKRPMRNDYSGGKTQLHKYYITWKKLREIAWIKMEDRLLYNQLHQSIVT